MVASPSVSAPESSERPLAAHGEEDRLEVRLEPRQVADVVGAAELAVVAVGEEPVDAVGGQVLGEPAAALRVLVCADGGQKIAIGFHGEPVPPGRRSGSPTTMNSERPSSSQAAASSSNWRLSETSMPIAATWSGWMG